MRAALAVAAFCALGVGPAGAAGGRDRQVGHGLFNRSYVIAAISSPTGRTPIRGPAEVEIGFGRKRRRDAGWSRSIGWEAHCNGHGGGLKIKHGRLVSGGTNQTLIACEGAAQREDAWLGRFFDARPRWSVRRGRLTLTTRLATLSLRPGTAPFGPP